MNNYLQKKLWFIFNLLKEKKCNKYSYKYCTDYPIAEFGDKEGELAPTRVCDVLSFDGNKMLYIKVYEKFYNLEEHGEEKTALVYVKSGYVYRSYFNSYWMKYYKKELD